MRLKKHSFIIIFLAISGALIGQSGFSLSAVLGMNASQMAGDALSGFNKVGLHTGLKAGYILSPRWDLNLEFLYTQKGSQPRWSDTNINGQKTSLNYAEIPVYATFNDWYIEEDEYYKVGLHAGASYARLISAKSGIGSISDEIDNIKNYDVSFLFGGFYAFSKKWVMTLRYTNSIIRIYKSDNLTNDGLISYLWSLRMEYSF